MGSGDPTSLAADIHLVLPAGAGVKCQIVSRSKPPPSILIEAESKVLGVVIAIIENYIEYGAFVGF